MNRSQQLINQSPILNQFQMMMPHSYGNWAQQPLNMSQMNNFNFPNQTNPKYWGRNNWKGNNRRKDMYFPGSGTTNVVHMPPINELEHQNRLKARRFHQKKKLNRVRPYHAHAPRNTTSYLIRAKKEGGIASLVSPCPVTPSVLPTPVFSPSREALVDMAKEEWGVDGYGTMNGLIRLRSPCGEEEEEEDCDSSDVEVERRLDQDLSRFEMITSNRLDLHLLEGENVALKERLYLMERELGEVKRRMQFLERQSEVVHQILQDVSESENDATQLLEDGSEDERKDDQLANQLHNMYSPEGNWIH